VTQHIMSEQQNRVSDKHIVSGTAVYNNSMSYWAQLTLFPTSQIFLHKECIENEKKQFLLFFHFSTPSKCVIYNLTEQTI